MAHNDHCTFVLSLLLITLATSSNRLMMVEARNLLETSLPELPLPALPQLPELPELPKPELPALPKVDLPQLPSLPELSFPSLPKFEWPNLADLFPFPQVPESSNAGESAIHKATPLSTTNP